MGSLETKPLGFFDYDSGVLLCRDKRNVHMSVLVNHIQSLSLCINMQKSKLEPSQVTQFLGLILDSKKTIVTLTLERQQTIKECISQFRVGRRGTVSSPNRSYGYSTGSATCSSTYVSCTAVPFPTRVSSPDTSVKKDYTQQEHTHTHNKLAHTSPMVG